MDASASATIAASGWLTSWAIDAANMDQLYDAFFTTKPGGMGMGLSISRSIIQGHGGQLWATPNPTHGTAFHFSLPVMATNAAVSVSPFRISPRSGP